ncbi:S8 family serine peptidase [Chloroflexales bacterium ZM16-3]|nr:S8 family serine peptidase [Chloroflexales bacterium ZM16-3]
MYQGRYKATLRTFSALILLSVGLLGIPGISAQSGTRPSGAAPADIESLRLPAPATASNKMSHQLDLASGRVSVVVRLSKSPAVEMTNQLAQGAAVTAEQDDIIARINQLDPTAKVLGRVKILLNAVMLDIDSAKLADLAKDVHVVTISPVVDFSLDLTETVPYIGATPDVQASADGGAGVRVAVLDSGIDYTHKAFGGAGTAEAYDAAYGADPTDPKNTTSDGLFPTPKVVGGYDFVGEAWPDGPLAPDEDPIDYEGHGTHVADIIGGAQGVAPAASLYAVKVCAAVSASCSGVALIQAMEFAADPDGDGRTSDHVDIVNMSLGSSYGNSYFDDLSTAVENASRLGILTVASAGNSGDRPYIIGTPSAAPSALAVAQTQVPSAKTYPLVVNSPISIATQYKNTATVDWAPIGAGFTGDVVYAGTACPGETLPDLTGKVALIDRGTCSVSLKTDSAAAAGAVGVLIGLTAPGDPFSFSFGGGTHMVPTLIITQSDANRIKANIALIVNVTVSDAVAIPLAGSMVSSSSRGPSIGLTFSKSIAGYLFGQQIKPEIGAPGASVSADVGTGTGSSAFGGTSGAAPMVTGAAALVLADNPRLQPFEVKALLMNTAETTIYTNPATQPGVLAPISRIGSGELRVDRALATGAAAWAIERSGATLSFGFVDVSRTKVTIYRAVEVKNYTAQPIIYGISSAFRYADDEANGAVSITPSRKSITVPAHRSRFVLVRLQIDGTKLRPWTMNSGSAGGSPNALNQMEYDGYLMFTDLKNADNNLHMPWHVLPRLSPLVRVSTVGHSSDTRDDDTHDDRCDDGDDDDDDGNHHDCKGDSQQSDSSRSQQQNPTLFTLKNQGVGAGTYTPLSLIGENPTAPMPGAQGSMDPNITARYVGATTFAVSPMLCSSGVLAQFGVQTWQPVTHANYPLEIDIYLDTNRDGTPDYVAYTSELNAATAFAGDGRNVTYAGPVDGPQTALFFTQHGTNSGAFILTVCGEQVGLTSADAGKLIDVDTYTFDNYFTGALTSHIPATMSVLNERYGITQPTDTTPLSSLSMLANSQATYGLYDFGVAGASPSEGGVLMLNTSGGASESLVIRATRCTKGDQSYDGSRGSSSCR